jgi:hypothetical protein
MAKLDIKNRQNIVNLSSDPELTADLRANGFTLNHESRYVRRIGNKSISVTFDLKILVADIRNPGRDETWDVYARIKCENTEQLASELSNLLNQML